MASACGESIPNIQVKMAGLATSTVLKTVGLRFSVKCMNYQGKISISTERTVKRAGQELEVFANQAVRLHDQQISA